MAKIVAEINIIRNGQPRPYADTENVSEITLTYLQQYGEDAGKMVPFDMSDDAFKKSPFSKLGAHWEPDAHWASWGLRSITKLEPGKWNVFCSRGFTD